MGERNRSQIQPPHVAFEDGHDVVFRFRDGAHRRRRRADASVDLVRDHGLNVTRHLLIIQENQRNRRIHVGGITDAHLSVKGTSPPEGIKRN